MKEYLRENWLCPALIVVIRIGRRQVLSWRYSVQMRGMAMRDR